MDKPISNFDFRFMSFGYKFRDFFNPPKSVLKEIDIKPGYYVLDYGCGPGSYSIAAAKMVGKSGKVYALDIHPFAIKQVNSITLGKKLENIETISSFNNKISVLTLSTVASHFRRSSNLF